MEIIKIEDDIYQFTFKKDELKFPYNITAIIDNETAIIIDVAYEMYAEQVKKYLTDKGILEFVIFISHHHEDHFDGCKSFKEYTTYASELFNNDYQEHLQSDDFLRSFMPTNFLIDGNYCKTEKFEIEYLYTPGHNKCEFSFSINNKYLYVGDLIFYDKNGLTSIPYLDNNSNIDEYIKSLNKIKKLNPKVLLLGHGNYLIDKDEIKKQIENRLFYLEKLKHSKGNIAIEKCLIESKSKYSGLNFHSSNLEKVLG